MVKLVAAAVVTIVLSACTYDVQYGACAVHCTDNSGCPDDLTCGAEGVCRAAEAPACLLPTDGTGGTITHVGGKTIHTFSATQSGSTFAPAATGDVTVELLVVAGGGGGGETRGGGGGGGGGVVHVESYAITQPAYVVTVGYGGASVSDGGDSSLGTVTAIGGGAGRACAAPNGGNGGGASHDTNDGPAGTGTLGQGHDGGSGGYNSGSATFTGAGGGGAGAAGQDGSPSAGGAGGSGIACAITGEAVFYGGGGGGGAQDLGTHGLSPGDGGSGAGDGGLNAPGDAAVNGTGGGGGGAGGGDAVTNFFSGGRGGDGVVVVSYPTTW